MSSQKLTDLLNEAAADAEDALKDDDPTAPLPERVTVSRPGRARSKVLQVRLTPEEFEALERIASQSELPVSTIARHQLLQLISGVASPSSAISQVWSGSPADEYTRIITEWAKTSAELSQSLHGLAVDIARIGETVPVHRDGKGAPKGRR